MEQENIQKAALDEALVSTDDRVKIDSCNMRIDPSKKKKEATYQVVLDILKLSPCYNAFLITADVPEIYMQQFWFTISKIKNYSSYQFQLDNQKFQIGVELFREIIRISSRVPNKEYVAPPPHDALVTFLKQLVIKIDNRQTSAKRRDNIPYPIFTKVIIHCFFSKHNSIPKRHNSFINTIKGDGILGKLKYVSEGEDKQMYGMSILYVMMNDDIKDTEAYQTYISLSIGIELLKKGIGKGKGLMGKKDIVTPSKKGLITADENIISDPDVAPKLGETISRTEAEEQEEARRVHETHERLMTKTTSNDEEEGRVIRRQSSSVVIRDTLKVLLNETLDQSQNLKGEIETLLSDDERTKSDQEKAESEKVEDKEVYDGKEVKDDDEIHDKEEKHDVNDEVHDDEKKHDDDEIAYEEEFDDERTESEKDDQEMVDAEKIDAEKAKEEKDDKEQSGDEQAKDDQAQDDQAVALISIPHKEKPKLPPSSSSLSPLFDYSNQFLNVSSDVSLVGIVKETANIKINSIIEEISLRKSSSFLDHDKHIDLYNALINYIVLGEAIEKGELDLTKVLNWQRHDDEDQDPPAESEKDNKKKRKRKDSEPSKDDQDGSSKKDKPPAKTSITDKSVQAEKIVAEHTQEVPMDTEEPSFDDVVNDADQS
ncbi:hypothetical protein Tco_0379125 [Tanacetum coccineum]